MKLEYFTKFDWRSLNKFISPRAADDLNSFLEKLPQNTNKSLLIITGIVWGSSLAMGLFTTVKMQEMSELSIEHAESEAVKPVVPQIQNKAVSVKDVNSFVDNLQETYKGLEITGNGNNIIIRGKSTALFGQFREAIGHIQNGGTGWRVNVDKLCIGKECKPDPLGASLSIKTVSVQ